METSSAYEMGRAIGSIIGALFCAFVGLFAVFAIIFACIKRTKGWIITAAIVLLIGVGGVVAVGVAAFRQIRAEARGEREFKTVVSKDGWVSLSVPASWHQLDELHADAILKFGNKFAEEYLAVISDSRADYVGTLDDFARLTATRMRDNLRNGTMSTPQSLTINGHRALRTTIEGAADDVRVCYMHTSVETPDGYHQILQWTLPSKKAKAFPIFEKVDVTFTVVKPRATEATPKPAARRSGSVEERVKAIVAEQFELKPIEVESEFRLTTDLGADELDLVELVMAIEEEFDVAIPDEEAEKLSRVSDIVKWLSRGKPRTETF